MSETLFDNRTKTKRAKTPRFVIEELIAAGVPERVARSLPVRTAFARMYAARRKSPIMGEHGRAIESGRVSRLLTDLSSERDPCPNELTNAAVEALSLLPAQKLSRVCAGLANLLAE